MAKSNVRPAGDIKQLSPTLFHKLEVTLRWGDSSYPRENDGLLSYHNTSR